MNNLYQELQTLAKCVKYQNLSQAAAHVGFSQPQLSRVISKIEGELDVVLLDRTARRKSAWTPMAFKIAQTYSQGVEKLNSELSGLLDSTSVTHLNFGSLEGMVPIAANIIHSLIKPAGLTSVDLQVYDLSELEVGFSKNQFDVILTNREPGKRKYAHQVLVGYQNIDLIKESDKFLVYSSFEFSTLGTKSRKKPSQPLIISNSLFARKYWLENFGGTGSLPSSISTKKPGRKDFGSVYLIGSDALAHKTWNTILETVKSAEI
jgi:hypothetical protein